MRVVHDAGALPFFLLSPLLELFVLLRDELSDPKDTAWIQRNALKSPTRKHATTGLCYYASSIHYWINERVFGSISYIGRTHAADDRHGVANKIIRKTLLR